MPELTLSLPTVSLRLLGAFYIFAGIVATRAAITGRFLDVTTAAIGGAKVTTAETRRGAWLLGSSLLILTGGVALALLSDLSPWVFGLNAIGQLLYLGVLAPRYFDAGDPPDEVGRRQTTNAAILYVLATAAVIWAAARGLLLPLWSTSPLVVVIAALVIAAYAFYAILSFVRPFHP